MRISEEWGNTAFLFRPVKQEHRFTTVNASLLK